MDWLAQQYPETFDKHYRPMYLKARQMQRDGKRFFNAGLPMLCQVCQIPMGFTEPGQPGLQSQRFSMHQGERYNTCSDGCQWIFEREPEKYRQAWLPVHQIYQGNCGGPTIPDVLKWYGIQSGDGGEYLDSEDAKNWERWHQPAGVS